MGGSALPHWSEVWARQEKRASLAPVYWDLAGGRPGFRVADVGCGPGYFALRFAALTGPTGHVHAVDVSGEALEFLRSKLDPFHHAGRVLRTDAAPRRLAAAVGEGLVDGNAGYNPLTDAHVTTEVLDIEHMPLPDLSFRAVFCTDTLHHVDDVRAALRNMRVPNARLVLAEFDPDGPGELGPPLDERIPPKVLDAALRETGWKTGPIKKLAHEHYAIVAG